MQVRRAKKKKGVKPQKVKHPTTTRAIDALIGYEKQKNNNKRNRSPTQPPWNIYISQIFKVITGHNVISLNFNFYILSLPYYVDIVKLSDGMMPKIFSIPMRFKQKIPIPIL